MTTNTQNTLDTLDQRVIKLREHITLKESLLGVCPKASYKSNLTYKGKNILVLKLDNVVTLVSELLASKDYYGKASNLIGCNKDFPYGDILEDLILRGKILKHQDQQKEINTLKSKLETLRSEELKRSDELDELESLLK